ncbi:MAG TPA: hypothetical protein VFU31_09985 [Candidatus Binatia bacterium]|nr:hypothetical protein [Candidatus Binatia bacterium]
MFGMDKITQFLKRIRETITQRRQKKLAEIAAMEDREREALVRVLAKKFAAAHADCEKHAKTSTVLELSFKEIMFIEWNLNTWTRYFEERQIYTLSPQR